MIGKIALHSVLPHVFSGMEKDVPVKDSQVWMRDVAIDRGRSYLITAESGTGKSSLMSYIYGLRTDYNGTIEFDGADIRSFEIDRWCGLRMRALAILPQEMRLFPELTVMENIEMKNRLTHYKSPVEISRMLDRLEIGAKSAAKVGKLSIGQQQRVALVRALCQPFDFLLLDEPVSHLDSRNNEAVASLVAEEAAALGAAVVATSVGNHLRIDNPEILRL